MAAKTFLGGDDPGGHRLDEHDDARRTCWGPTRSTRRSTSCSRTRNHAQFLIRKLWAEFIASPIPQATLDAWSAPTGASGYQLKPLMRGILINPLIFESIDEPNLIKPPIVYIVGVLRQLGAPLKGTTLQRAMNNMQQRSTGRRTSRAGRAACPG